MPAFSLAYFYRGIMALSSSVLHGNLRPRDLIVALSLSGLILLQLWELPVAVANHGGFAFFAAWALCLLVLGLPLLLLELMLGRRSRRAPIEGLAVLTREADTARGWRFSAWLAALASLVLLAAVALIAGGSINFLGREMSLAATQSAHTPALLLPAGAGLLLVVAAGLSVLAPAKRAVLLGAGFVVVCALLLVAALAGVASASAVYKASALTLADWRDALRLALLSAGTGFGVAWVRGMHLPKEYSLSRFALTAVAVQIFLALLLLSALAPFVAAVLANTRGLTVQADMHIVPTGVSVWLLLSALLLGAVLASVIVAEPLLVWLVQKGRARITAIAVVFAAAVILAEAVWCLKQAAGLQGLLQLLAVLLLLAMLGFSVFAGWVMKTSHARKELALPSEGIYNLWRVAVRIALPLTILWILTAAFL
jgi:SNF family Na+-dependent transporter